MDIELTDRQHIILKAIIQNYLETGEPVGSRTLSKSTDLNLSSATIRNEMADLEDMGYIFQPHTSAGRIPSDLGYRYYVNCLMEENDEIRIRETEREKEHQDLINKMTVAAAELEPEVRQTEFDEIWSIITDEVPVIWIYSQAADMIYAKGLHVGGTYPTQSVVRYEDMYWE